MGQSVGPKSLRPVVGPNSVRPWTSAAGPYIVSTAREQVAELIAARPLDVIFTSCATESNNAAIAAALKANPTKRHIVTSLVEHSSVLNYCMALERGGLCSGVGIYPDPIGTPPRPESRAPSPESRYPVTYLPVDREGLLRLCLGQLTTDH